MAARAAPGGLKKQARVEAFVSGSPDEERSAANEEPTDEEQDARGDQPAKKQPKDEGPELIETSSDDRGYRNVRQMREEEGPIRYRMPDPTRREMFAIADQLLGASKMIVMCEDGKSRMARIPGKMKRRMWIKPGDLVIIRPWDIQDDKADVRYRYIRNQAVNMSRRGLVPELLDGSF